MRYLIFLLFSLAIGVSSSMAQNTIQSLPRGSAMNLHDQTFFEIEDYSLPPSQAGKSMSWATILMSLDVRYIQGLGTPTLDSNFVLTIPITGKTDLTVDLSPLRQGLSGGGTGAESFADLTGQISAGQIPNDIITQLMLSPNLVSVLNSFLNEGAVDARIRSADNVGSETEYGVFQKASITDATSGTSTAKVLTPSTLVNSINSNGRIKEEIEDNTETLLANPKPSDKGAIHSTWLGNSPSDGGTSYDDTELRGRVTQNETDITDLRGRVTTLENEPDPIDTNTHNNDFRAVADSNARGDLTEDDVTIGGLVLEADRGGFLTPYLESGSLAYRPFLFGRPHFISGSSGIPVLEGDFAIVGDKVYLAKQTDLATTGSTNFGTSDWIDLTKDNDTIYDDTDLKGRVTDLETEVSQLHVLGSYIDSIRSFHNRWSESHTSTSRIDTSQGYSNFFDYRSGSSNYLSSGITFDDSQDAIVLPTNSLIRVVSFEWTSLDNHETIAFRNSSGQDVPFVRLEGGVLQYNSSGSRSGINWVNAGIPPSGTQVRPNIGDTLILQVRPSGSGIRVVPVIKLTQGTTSVNDDVFQELNDFEISNADPDLTRWEFRGVTNYKGFDPSQSLSHDQLEDLLRDHIDQMWAFGKARLIQTDTEVDQYGPKINFQNNLQVEGTELPDYIRTIAGSETDTPSGGVTLEQVNSAIQSAVEDYALSGSPNALINDNRISSNIARTNQIPSTIVTDVALNGNNLLFSRFGGSARSITLPSGGGSGVTLDEVNSAIASAVEDYALSGSPNALININRIPDDIARDSEIPDLPDAPSLDGSYILDMKSSVALWIQLTKNRLLTILGTLTADEQTALGISSGGGGGSTLGSDNFTISGGTVTVPSGRTLGDYFQIQIQIDFSTNASQRSGTDVMGNVIPVRLLIESSETGLVIPFVSRGADAYSIQIDASSVTSSSTSFSMSGINVNGSTANPTIVVDYAIGVRF